MSPDLDATDMNVGVEGVRSGDGFLAEHSRRAALRPSSDEQQSTPIVGGADQAADRSVAERLAAVEPLVRGVCRARLGPVDGDDAAQRTLITLWRKLEAGPAITSLPEYAAVCARYETLPHASESRGEHPIPIGDLTEGPLAAESLVAEPSRGLEEQAVREAAIGRAEEHVAQLLATLPPRQAAVLRATKLEGCDAATAAAELGMTRTAVHGAQHRAMNRLRTSCGTRPAPTTSAEQDAFAAQVRRSREATGLSTAALARIIERDRSYLSQVELGRAWPSRDLAARLDAALGTKDTLRRAHDGHQPTGRIGPTEATDRAVVSDRGEVTDRTAVGVDRTPVEPHEHASTGGAAAAGAVTRAAVAATVARDVVHAEAADTARAEQLRSWHADDTDQSDTTDLDTGTGDHVDDLGEDHGWGRSA